MFAQHRHLGLSQFDGAYPSVLLGLLLLHPLSGAVLALHAGIQTPSLQIDIAPAEADELPAAHPRADRQVDEGIQAVTAEGVQELGHLAGGQHALLELRRPRRRDHVRGIAHNQTLPDRILQRGAQQVVLVADGPGR